MYITTAPEAAKVVTFLVFCGLKMLPSKSVAGPTTWYGFVKDTIAKFELVLRVKSFGKFCRESQSSPQVLTKVYLKYRVKRYVVSFCY